MDGLEEGEEIAFPLEGEEIAFPRRSQRLSRGGERRGRTLSGDYVSPSIPHRSLAAMLVGNDRCPDYDARSSISMGD